MLQLFAGADTTLLEECAGISTAFDHWISTVRSQCVDLLRATCESELNLIEVSGGPSREQITAARRITAADSTNERASRILMRALIDHGNRVEAIREYDRLTGDLRQLLDLSPSRETRAFVQAIRAIDDIGNGVRRDTVQRKEVQTGSVASSPLRFKVAVLPFLPISDVPNYLPVALAQEIAGALGRFRWFDIVAPLALRNIREEGESANAVLQKLSIHYALDGTISLGNGRITVRIDLIDIHDGFSCVWSDRFSMDAESLADLNAKIISLIVAQIDPIILFIEGNVYRARHVSLGTKSLLEAIPLIYVLDRQSYERAGRLIQTALTSEPENPMVPAWSALWWMFKIGQGWAQSIEEALAFAERMCLRALRLDPLNAQALSIYAHLKAFYHGDYESALYYFDRSLKTNPNLALSWAFSAPTYCYIGRADMALERLDHYRSLSPFDPHFSFFEGFYVIAHFFSKNYEVAASIGRRAVAANPDYTNGYKPLIGALGFLGLSREAEYFITELLKREPGFCIERFVGGYPIRQKEDREHYIEGLRRAGAPERPQTREKK